MYEAGGRGKWRHGGGTRQERLGPVGHPRAAGSASPWPTLVATGHCPAIARLPLASGRCASQLSTSVSGFTPRLTHKSLGLACWFLVKAGVKDKSAPEGL